MALGLGWSGCHPLQAAAACMRACVRACVLTCRLMCHNTPARAAVQLLLRLHVRALCERGGGPRNTRSRRRASSDRPGSGELLATITPAQARRCLCVLCECHRLQRGTRVVLEAPLPPPPPPRLFSLPCAALRADRGNVGESQRSLLFHYTYVSMTFSLARRSRPRCRRLSGCGPMWAEKLSRGAPTRRCWRRCARCRRRARRFHLGIGPY
jgi:hypothetical protein